MSPVDLSFASCGLDDRTSMTISQNDRAGRPSRRSPASRAMISDSVDECDTAVCFLQNQLIGTKVRGPIKTRKAALVDLLSFKSPANDASQNNAKDMFSGLSPIHAA